MRAYPSGYEHIKPVRKSMERLDPVEEKKKWQRFSVVDFYRGPAGSGQMKYATFGQALCCGRG